MGLLSKASILDKIPELAFSDFLFKHSLHFCALLEKNNSNYYITSSIGFDAQSIISSISTVDFWQGICPEEGKIYNFSDTEKTPFLQLFSTSLKEKIREISVYKNFRNQILICADKLSDQAVKDFEKTGNVDHKNNYQNLNSKLKENSVVLLFKLNIKNAAENFYDDANVNPALLDKDHFICAIQNEIINRFTCLYNLPDSTVKDGFGKIKTLIITDKAYSAELIRQHFLLNLKEVLEKAAELIEVDFSGTAASCNDIQSFMQAE